MLVCRQSWERQKDFIIVWVAYINAAMATEAFVFLINDIIPVEEVH